LYASVLALVAAPYAPAASREIQELQRDVAQIQDQVKALQNSQNEKLASLSTLVQQAIDSAKQTDNKVAVIQAGFDQNLKDQQTKVVTPVVGLSTRMDQMAQNFSMLQGAVSDLTSLIGKLQAQLTDLNNAVKILQTPASPPPSPTGGAGTGPGPNAAAETPTVPAAQLYEDAQRDRTKGNLELALDEYSKYLKWYGNTDLAPNAQYYIAWIHYSQSDYEDALKEFDLVLEKYSDNNKIPESLYYKGMTLVRLGRRTQGAEEFRELQKRFPMHDLSRQACSQLTTMGLRCAATSAAAPKAPAKRKKS
jgi:TolA-binding protein